MSEATRRPILRSRRLFLRPAEAGDVDTLVAWFNDADFLDTLGGRGLPSPISMKRWLEDLWAVQGKTRWYFLICLRDSGDPIGIVDLDSVDHVNGGAELAIGIADEGLRGQGYGTEAAQALLDLGFGELRLQRIHLDVFDFNHRAVHLYEKLGFRRECTLREAEYQHGRYVDVHVMGILRAEWEPQDRPRSWELD